MKNITEIKKAIGIFRTYGIPLTGKRKAADFYRELQMDKVFVDGLIFELELELKKEVESAKLEKVNSPSDLLECLFTS